MNDYNDLSSDLKHQRNDKRLLTRCPQKIKKTISYFTFQVFNSSFTICSRKIPLRHYLFQTSFVTSSQWQLACLDAAFFCLNLLNFYSLSFS